MDPADSTRVVFGEGCPSDSQPVSPEAVVKYLVQNEPLTHVAGILRCVDGYTSELKQESLTMEALGTAIDMERGIMSSIGELLRECQGIYSTVGKRTKEAEDVIDTRSQDLRGVIAQLRSTPLTTPPAPPLGITGPSVTQMSTKVDEIGTAQTDILNGLQVTRDILKVALDGLADQRKSMQTLLGISVRQTGGPPPSPCVESTITTTPVHTSPALQFYDSLWERYQRGSQEFQSGIDSIVKNGEIIRDLALVLERTRDLDPIIAPLPGRLPTLAEELSAYQAPDAYSEAVPPLIFHDQSSHWRLSAACFERLEVWAESLIRNLLALYIPVRPSFLVSALLVVPFVLVNVMRARNRVSGPDPGQGAFNTAISSSIRDLLLGDKANISDELICNLVPKR